MNLVVARPNGIKPKVAHVSLILVLSALVAAMGGLLFGFDTAVIAGTTDALTRTFSLTPGALGLTVSSALWGTILGALVGGNIGERWGRRGSLRMMAVLYVISAGGCALAWSWPSLLLFRIIGGIGIGGSSVLGPMYIAEISPSAWRGRLVAFFQLNIVIGILFAYLSNYLVGRQQLGLSEWRWEFAVPGLPAALFLLLLFFIPRSPRWLVNRGRLDEARAVLEQIGETEPDAEIERMVNFTKLESQSSGDKLFIKRNRLPIILAVSMGLFCQLSGINAILYYLNDIFAAAGFGKLSGALQTVIIGATTLVFTVLGMLCIDKLGRKILLMIGSVGMAGTLCGVAWIFQTHAHLSWLLWLLVTYCAFFSFAEGTVMWVYIGEVFSTRMRAKGLALGSISHWIMNAIISAVFPLMAAHSGAYPFWFFAAMMVLQFVVVALIFPETKGVSLEENSLKIVTSPARRF